MQKPFTFKAYDFTLTAGGSQAILAGGEYFRILSATGALDVTVEGKGTMPDLLAGQAVKNLPFSRLVLRDKSGAPNTGYILVASSEFVDNRMFGTFDLSATTLAALEFVSVRPEGSTGSYKSLTAPVTNVAEQIFSAGANVNGAILLSANCGYHDTVNVGFGAFVAKATAPASVTDGEVFLLTDLEQSAAGGYNGSATLPAPAYVAAGLGLYYIHSSVGSNHTEVRAARYRLL